MFTRMLFTLSIFLKLSVGFRFRFNFCVRCSKIYQWLLTVLATELSVVLHTRDTFQVEIEVGPVCLSVCDF